MTFCSMRFCLFILIMSLLVGCDHHADPTGVVNRPDEALADHSELTDAHVIMHVQGVELSVPRPHDWEHYETEYGIVLAEEIGSVATDGRLNGLLTHVFVHPLEEFSSILGTQSSNLAHELLDAIVHNPDYVGTAHVTAPVAFDWNGLDAAYYLMKNHDGNVTIVIGVVAPNSNQLVATSISAPIEQAARLGNEIAQLLHGMMINEVALNGAALDVLLDPFQFPST